MTHLPDEGTEFSAARSLPPSPDATPPPASLLSLPAPFRLLSWRAGIVLAGLLAYSLFSSLLRSPNSTYFVRAERVEAFQDALRATKLAYARRLQPQLQGEENLLLLHKMEDDAITQWTQLTQKKTSRPAEWRRLGIALAVFGRPGGLETLRHIAVIPLYPPDTTSNSPNSRSPQEKEEAVLVPRGQEIALWDAIYGPQPILPSQVPKLRATLARLDLDWFESLAAVDLSIKAKMPQEAERARIHATSATRPLLTLLALQSNVLLFGFIVLAGFLIKGYSGVPAFGRSGVQDTPAVGNREEETGNNTNAQLPISPTPNTQHPTPERLNARTPERPFPPAALLITFVLYLGITLLIGLPLLLARPFLLGLPNVTLFRLNSVLNIGVQALVVTIALKMLRRLAYVASGNDRIASLRELLFRLGFRDHSLSACVWAGLLGFAVSRPLILVGSLISNRLLHHFPTPPHPLTLSVAVMHSPLDIFLLVLSSSILAPIIEEMMFRGMLYPALRARWGVVKGAALSAAVFSLVHPTMPGQFLPLWALGLVFTLLYEWRGSLLPGILLHALNNGFALLTYLAILKR